MFIAMLFIIAKMWKQLTPIDRYRNKMWCIHTVEYYSALKRKEILHMIQHG